MIRFIKEWFSRRANPTSKAESAPADEAATDEQSTDADTSPTAPPTIPDAVEVELQRRFNEFERRFNDRQREILDYRENSINRWLAIVAIVLTVFGIVIPIAGVLSFKEFEEIKTQAQSYVKEIKQYRDEAENLTQDINAKIVADNPTKAKQIIEDVRENPKASPTDKAIAKAVSLQGQGKGEEALKIWQGIADAFEEVDRALSTRAWFSVGYLLIQQGKPEDAIDAYDEAIRLKPNFAEAYNNRGNAKSDLGRHEVAIADYDEAIRLKPNFAEAYNNRGTAKEGLYRYEVAIADYDEAIRLKPNLAEAYNNRGNVKTKLGHHENAIDDYNQAIQQKPDYAIAYKNRGIAKSKLGQIDKARQDFEKARDLARKAGNNSLVALVEQGLRELENQEGE